MASGSGNGSETTYINTGVSAGKKAVVKSRGNIQVGTQPVLLPIVHSPTGKLGPACLDSAPQLFYSLCVVRMHAQLYKVR